MLHAFSRITLERKVSKEKDEVEGEDVGLAVPESSCLLILQWTDWPSILLSIVFNPHSVAFLVREFHFGCTIHGAGPS